MYQEAIQAISQQDRARAYFLAWLLHPEPQGVVAWRIVCEAVNELWQEAQNQVRLLGKRERNRTRYVRDQEDQGKEPRDFRPQTMPIPPGNLLQFTVLKVSDRWERDQSQGNPAKEPRYVPTQPALLVRFVAWLAWHGLRPHPFPVGLGLGHHLYGYDPKALFAILLYPYVSDGSNLAHRVDELNERLQKRFPGLALEPKRVPTDAEQALIETALDCLRPWVPPRDASAALADDPHWHTICRFIDPAVGIPQLVHTDAVPRDRALLQGTESLRLPFFPQHQSESSNDDTPSTPPPLDERHLSTLDTFLAAQQHRREAHTGAVLRVDVDGERYGTFTSFRALDIPSATRFVEVWGEDDQGELLLAAFALAPVEEEPQQALVRTLEGGQEVALYLAPSHAEDTCHLYLTYHAAPSHVPQADFATLATRMGALLQAPARMAATEATVLLQRWYHLLCCRYCQARVPETVFAAHASLTPLFGAEEGTDALWMLPFYVLQTGQASAQYVRDFRAQHGDEEYAFYRSFLLSEQIDAIERDYQWRSNFRFWLEIHCNNWAVPFLDQSEEDVGYFTALLQELHQHVGAVGHEGRLWMTWLQRQLHCYTLIPQVAGAGPESEDWAEPHSLFYTCLPPDGRLPLVSPFLEEGVQASLFFHIFHGHSGAQYVATVPQVGAQPAIMDAAQLQPSEAPYFIVASSDPDPQNVQRFLTYQPVFVVEVRDDYPVFSSQVSPRERSILLAQAGFFDAAWHEAAAALRHADRRLYLLFLWSAIFAPMQERLDQFVHSPLLRDELREGLRETYATVRLIHQALHEAVQRLAS